jgi:hypothetical protein
MTFDETLLELRSMSQQCIHAPKSKAFFDGLIETLQAMRVDTDIVNWLEANGELAHLYEEGRPDKTTPVIQVPKFDFDFEDLTIRMAINKARSS